MGGLYSPPAAEALPPMSPQEAPATPYDGSSCYSPTTTCYVGSPYSPVQAQGESTNTVHDYLDLENAQFHRKDYVISTIDPDDLALVTATLAAEATGSNTHIVKDELRFRIQKKRRDSGKNPLKAEYKSEGPEQVCFFFRILMMK